MMEYLMWLVNVPEMRYLDSVRLTFSCGHLFLAFRCRLLHLSREPVYTVFINIARVFI